MQFDVTTCPQCGEPANGILEQVQGRAHLEVNTKTGAAEYGGETEMFWDEQRPVLREGKAVLLCHNGHDWDATDSDADDE